FLILKSFSAGLFRYSTFNFSLIIINGSLNAAADLIKGIIFCILSGIRKIISQKKYHLETTLNLTFFERRKNVLTSNLTKPGHLYDDTYNPLSYSYTRTCLKTQVKEHFCLVSIE